MRGTLASRSMLGLLVLCCVLCSTSARACGNAVELSLNQAKKLVARVEQLLEQHDLKRAAILLDHDAPPPGIGGTMRESESEDYIVADPALAHRIRLLEAVVEERTGYYSNAIARLRAMRKTEHDDPYIAARLAEALSHRTSGDAEALRLLADLESRDLVPDPEAWAVLAELRSRKGDAAGQARALSRCRAIARDASVCGGEAPQATR